jgi:hypothetical protein
MKVDDQGLSNPLLVPFLEADDHGSFEIRSTGQKEQEDKWDLRQKNP